MTEAEVQAELEEVLTQCYATDLHHAVIDLWNNNDHNTIRPGLEIIAKTVRQFCKGYDDCGVNLEQQLTAPAEKQPAKPGRYETLRVANTGEVWGRHNRLCLIVSSGTVRWLKLFDSLTVLKTPEDFEPFLDNPLIGTDEDRPTITPYHACGVPQHIVENVGGWYPIAEDANEHCRRALLAEAMTIREKEEIKAKELRLLFKSIENQLKTEIEDQKL